MQLDKENYQSFFDHAIEGIFRTAPDGYYISANPALARIYGYDSPADLKQHLTNIANQLYVKPKRRREFVLAVQTHGSVSDFESQIYRKDGSIIWISENARVVRDDHGKILYYEGFVTDITRRKQTEEALYKQGEKQRAFLSAMPDPMLLIRKDGMCLNCMVPKDKQPEDFFPLNECLGKNLTDFFPQDVARSFLKHSQLALETGTMQIFEYNLFLNETKQDFEARIVASNDQEVLAIIRSITERKKAEQLKNEFVSIVSHELRTPLTSIRGSLGLIVGTMTNELPPKAKTMVEIAYKNSERLVSLVNDILDIDKIESGKMIFELAPVDTISLLEQAIEANRAFGEQLGITFVLAQTLPEVKVYVDSNRLIQVLTNLLSNAAKFSPRNSSVTISMSKQKNMVRISVTDHGPGIPKEFHERIFQKFAQADSSATRQKGGSGLGLSISKAIIEKHGGKIGFETTEGTGSTFYFDLPIWQDSVTVASLLHKPRILICEDTPDLAHMLSLMLSYHGFECDIAYNTTQAKQLLEHNQYAAMTLDLVMPGQSGIDLIRELREQEKTRHLPIVVLSALASSSREELEGGAFEVADWLDKPVDYHRLTMSIQHAISQRAHGRPRILHVEDDSDVFAVTSAILQEIADTSLARSLKEAQEKIAQEPFDLIILDISLPDGSGLDLLTHIHNLSRIPVMIFSAREISQEVAQKVSAALVKSRTSNQELLNTIKSLISYHSYGGKPYGGKQIEP